MNESLEVDATRKFRETFAKFSACISNRHTPSHLAGYAPTGLSLHAVVTDTETHHSKDPFPYTHPSDAHHHRCADKERRNSRYSSGESLRRSASHCSLGLPTSSSS